MLFCTVICRTGIFSKIHYGRGEGEFDADMAADRKPIPGAAACLFVLRFRR